MPQKNGLPAFVDIPPQKESRHIFGSPEGYWVEGEREKVYDSPIPAYDHIEKDLGLEASFDEQTFLNVGNKAHIKGLHNGLWFEPFPKKKYRPKGRTTSRLLMSYDKYAKEEYLKDRYKDFLKLDKKWRKNKKDFVLAYQWLSGHPLFWKRYEYGNGDFSWDSDFDLSFPSVYTRKGKSVVLLEVTAYFEDRSQKMLDLKTIASGSTFEQAICRLAVAFDSFYDTSGVARKDVKMKSLPKYVQRRAGWDKELSKKFAKSAAAK